MTSLHRFKVRFYAFRICKTDLNRLLFLCKQIVCDTAQVINVKPTEQHQLSGGQQNSHFCYLQALQRLNTDLSNSTVWLTSFTIGNSRREDNSKLSMKKIVPKKTKKSTDHFCPWGRKVKKNATL